MIWPKGNSPRLYEATEAETPSGSGSGTPVSNKLKIGSQEYAPELAESAMSLYNALSDPDTGQEIIRRLADKAGLLNTPKSVESQSHAEDRMEGAIHKALKGKLGKDYEKFSDAVGPALDEAIQSIINERFQQATVTNTQSGWEKSVDKFNGEYTLTPEIEEAMRELIEDAPPNLSRKGFDAQKYLDRMYNAAVDELGIEKPRRKSGTRGKEERDDEFPEFVVRPRPERVTVNDAVEAAMQGIRFRK